MKIKRPKRFGPEWWACYAAAFAVERAASEKALRKMGDACSAFDRVRNGRSGLAERCATIADDAIQGLVEADKDGCVDAAWTKLYPTAYDK